MAIYGLPNDIITIMEKVYARVIEMYTARMMYQQYLGVIVDPDNKIDRTNPFLRMLDRAFTESMLVYVRAISKQEKTANSLTEVLRKLKHHHKKITKEEFLDAYEGTRGDEHWNTFTLLAKKTLPLHIIERDEEVISRYCKRIKDYVDQHLAHHDKNAISDLPTYLDQYKAFVMVEFIVMKYATLLLLKNPQMPKVDFSWSTILDKPWRRSDST